MWHCLCYWSLAAASNGCTILIGRAGSHRATAGFALIGRLGAQPLSAAALPTYSGAKWIRTGRKSIGAAKGAPIGTAVGAGLLKYLPFK